MKKNSILAALLVFAFATSARSAKPAHDPASGPPPLSAEVILKKITCPPEFEAKVFASPPE
ncbi:MAG: hypothetical protein WCN98_17140, partial [Verrucomicrobiaceae bacterium]